MLVIALTYYMLPEMKKSVNRMNVRRGMWVFWLTTGGVLGMVLSLTMAGTVQVYLERMAGMSFITVKTQYMNFWFIWRLIFGTVACTGVVVYAADVVSFHLTGESPAAPGPPAALASGG